MINLTLFYRTVSLRPEAVLAAGEGTCNSVMCCAVELFKGTMQVHESTVPLVSSQGFSLRMANARVS